MVLWVLLHKTQLQMCNLEVKGYSVPVEYSSLDALYAVSITGDFKLILLS